MNAETAIDLRLGGAGGVYFLAEPGELTVEVEKCDRHLRDRRTDLRAVLAGPDRQVLQDVTLPDDGLPLGSGWGPPRRTRLSVRVDHKGVYALNITLSNDRYGEEVAWGFRTGCKSYLIETSRGHKDARHEEPIVLLQPDRPGDLCFLPRSGAFGMDISDLPSGVDALPVYDADGVCLHTLRVGPDRRAAHTFPADPGRGATPWRLHLPAQQAVVHIDGLTRWEAGDPYPDLPLWTPHLESFFPYAHYRWLLTPYSRTVYGRPGQTGEVAFQAYNNAPSAQTLHLEVEHPDSRFPKVHLAVETLELAPNQTAEVRLGYTVPPGASPAGSVCHLRVTPEEDPAFSTYVTLIVKPGEAPAVRPLDMPIVLKPYRHENEQFGYRPDYPLTSQVYFDLENVPFVRTDTGIATWRDGRWTAADFRAVVRSPEKAGTSFGMPSTKIAFDRHNDLYLVASVARRPVLLHSADSGRTFSVCPIEGREETPRTFDIEQFSGHNVPDGPPPVVRYSQLEADPQRIWRRINALELFLPQKAGGGLTMGDPVLVSDRCIGFSAHSGAPSSVVSRDGRVHVAWAEATDPEADVPGVPTYVATYDIAAGRLSEPALVGYGPPPNDVHNSPCIAMDGRGYLHVLVGTHGRTFKYARSLRPNTASAGWTEAVDVGEGLKQTYVGLVCGRDDALHLVYRLGWDATGYFPAGNSLTLSHQRKAPDGPWEQPRTLIVPPFSEYSVYYHRLTIDRTGRLFLSYDYWSTYWFYRIDHRGRRRTLLVSPDGGTTWKLAETRDLVRTT